MLNLGVKLLPLDMTCCPPLLFQGHPSSPTSSRRRAAAALVVELGRAVFYSFSAGCYARLAAASLSLPLSFSSFPFLSAAWTSDVVASWNASFPFAPSFLHRFRLSSERFKSSTAHTFGAKQVGLSKILRHGLEKSR